MRQAKSSSYDLLIAVLVTVAGGTAMMAALLNRWDPSEISAGVEGSLTAVALCPIFALLHGLSYTDTLKLCAPVLGIELIVGRAVAAPILPMMGIALLVIGFLGFVASLRAPALRRRSRRAVAASTPLAH